MLLRLTFDVRHNEHLRLRKSLLEVVEMDGAVKGDEAYFCPRVSRKPRTHMDTRNGDQFLSSVFSPVLTLQYDYFMLWQYF